jgi:hydroxylaminobenzene mutase
MNPIPQQLLISGTVLFLLGLLIGFALQALPNPRKGVTLHATGLQSGMALWALGLMWQRLALPAGAQRATQVLAVLGLYAIFASLLLAAVWGTSRATPIAGGRPPGQQPARGGGHRAVGRRLAGDRGRRGAGVVGPVRFEGLSGSLTRT